QDYYIYQGLKNYRKFNFNWLNYLNSFDFVSKTSNSVEIKVPNIRLICKNKDPENGEIRTYHQNSNAIKKGSIIVYSIVLNGNQYYKKAWETIEWKAFNSGKEAKDAKELIHDFNGKNR